MRPKLNEPRQAQRWKVRVCVQGVRVWVRPQDKEQFIAQMRELWQSKTHWKDRAWKSAVYQASREKFGLGAWGGYRGGGASALKDAFEFVGERNVQPVADLGNVGEAHMPCKALGSAAAPDDDAVPDTIDFTGTAWCEQSTSLHWAAGETPADVTGRLRREGSPVVAVAMSHRVAAQTTKPACGGIATASLSKLERPVLLDVLGQGSFGNVHKCI